MLAYSKANKEFQVGYVIYCEDIKMPYVWTCTLVGECEEISHICIKFPAKKKAGFVEFGIEESMTIYILLYPCSRGVVLNKSISESNINIFLKGA